MNAIQYVIAFIGNLFSKKETTADLMRPLTTIFAKLEDHRAAKDVEYGNLSSKAFAARLEADQAAAAAERLRKFLP